MRTCFVVMGFGKKVCYETGRTLDLNATYETIIQPAVEGQGLRCIRADEITQSGIIDVKMYDMLLRADLVIADISTGNVNAVYELGVRHALRPNSTIIMKEDKGRLYFDLDHVSTFHYSHYGSDIMAREAIRAVKALGVLIESIMANPEIDSPVYTYLPKLISPRMSDEEFEDLVDEAEAAQRHLQGLMKDAELLMKKSDHLGASKSYAAIAKLRPNEPDIIQKLALNVYKAKFPDEVSALLGARKILQQLTPMSSNDPETLGISGAVSKNLWLLQQDKADLDSAITFYRRGYEVARDYYNGENLALCFEFRAKIQENRSEKIYDFMSAKKIREGLIEILVPVVEAQDFFERPDRLWVFATLANSYYSQGDEKLAGEYEFKFKGAAAASWQIETFDKSKAFVLEMTDLRNKILSESANQGG